MARQAVSSRTRTISVIALVFGVATVVLAITGPTWVLNITLLFGLLGGILAVLSGAADARSARPRA